MTALDVLPPWHRSCRADIPIAPDTIAGILDGDESLTLVGRRGRQVPAVSLSMRDDDPTPLAVAASLAACIGQLAGHVHATEREVHWRSVALADVAVVVRFPKRHPPPTLRGAGPGFGGPGGGIEW